MSRPSVSAPPRLWSAIDSLPEKLRLVIVLSGIEGHDTREVASILGIPEGTVPHVCFWRGRVSRRNCNGCRQNIDVPDEFDGCCGRRCRSNRLRPFCQVFANES